MVALHSHLEEDGMLSVITMSQEVEDKLTKDIRETEQGTYLALDPDTADQIISSIKEETDKAMAKNIQPILISSPTLRRHIKRMADHFIPSLMVLSQSELLSEMRFKSIGEVRFAYGS